MPLNTDERNSIEMAFMRGPGALLERGWNRGQIEEFFARSDVKVEIEALTHEFSRRDAYAARLKFGLKRELARLSQGAAAILGAALAGPIYARDKQGNVITDAKGHAVLREVGPTRNQMVAATEILDRVGAAAEGKAASGMDRANVAVNLNFGQDERLKVEIIDDPSYTTKEERALSRERCRNVIEVLSERLPAIRKRAAKQIPALGRSKVVKKKAKKKAKKRVKVKAT